MKKENPYLIELAGHSKRYLQVSGLRSACGSIEDGVGFSHWGTSEFDPDHCEGGWVMSFADLEKLYNAARAARSA